MSLPSVTTGCFFSLKIMVQLSGKLDWFLLEMTTCTVWKRCQSLNGCGWQSFHPFDLGSREWQMDYRSNTIQPVIHVVFLYQRPPICLCKTFVFEKKFFKERLDLCCTGTQGLIHHLCLYHFICFYKFKD